MPMPAFKKDPPTDPTIFDRLGISGALPDWLYDRSTLDKNFPVADPEASVLENTGNFLARIPWELPYAAADVVNAGERMLSRPVVSQDPVAVGDALMVAGAAPLGGVAARAATGAAIPDNAAGMFGGRLAKTADRMALANAERMVADGTPRDKIWNETGWFKGVDGKWRFEIDDSKSRVTDTVFDDIKSKGAHYGSLGTAMEHPSLFAAYPSAENVGATFHAKAKPIGNFHADSNSLEVAGPSTGAQRSIGLHEGQHWVQSKEGLARGSAPERELPNVRDEMDSRLAEFYQSSDRLMKANPEAAKLFREYNQATISKDFDKAIALEERLASMPEGQQLLENLFERSRIAVADVSELALDRYRQHAGEVEARAVQKRRSLTPEERRARPPWLDYDVPEAKQIVRFANPDDVTTGTVLDAVGRQSAGYSFRPTDAKMLDAGVARDLKRASVREGIANQSPREVFTALRNYSDDMKSAGDGLDGYSLYKDGADTGLGVFGVRDGDLFDVAWIGGRDGTYSAANRLGPGELRSAMRAFREQVPGVQVVEGLRSSGAGPGRMQRVRSEMFANSDDVTTGTVLDAVGRASNLPMDKASRMARAKELGFDTEQTWYHGTPETFDQFDPGRSKWDEGAVWLTDNPNLANEFATRHFSAKSEPRVGSVIPAHIKRSVMPVEDYDDLLRARGVPEHHITNPRLRQKWAVAIEADFVRRHRKNGAPGAVLRNGNNTELDGQYFGDKVAIFDPSNTRSVKAAFDPAKKDSANLLAANPNDVTTGTLMDAIARQRAATELDRRLQEDGPERWS
jgi:hypothetical protein